MYGTTSHINFDMRLHANQWPDQVLLLGPPDDLLDAMPGPQSGAFINGMIIIGTAVYAT